MNNKIIVNDFSIMASIGVMLSYLFMVITAYKNKLNIRYLNLYLLISIIPTIICGKILFYISTCTTPHDFVSIFSNSGFVFFGGLIGFLIGIRTASTFFKIKMIDCMNCFAIPILIAQSFGRIGCLYNGCCYGIHYNGFLSISYREDIVFPVQPLESVLCISLALVMVLVPFGSRFYFYCLFYGIVRFLTEFLRGDDIRGLWLFFSTSQWICIFFIFFGFYNIKLFFEKKPNLSG